MLLKRPYHKDPSRIYHTFMKTSQSVTFRCSYPGLHQLLQTEKKEPYHQLAHGQLCRTNAKASTRSKETQLNSIQADVWIQSLQTGRFCSYLECWGQLLSWKHSSDFLRSSPAELIAAQQSSSLKVFLTVITHPRLSRHLLAFPAALLQIWVPRPFNAWYLVMSRSHCGVKALRGQPCGVHLYRDQQDSRPEWKKPASAHSGCFIKSLANYRRLRKRLGDTVECASSSGLFLPQSIGSIRGWFPPPNLGCQMDVEGVPPYPWAHTHSFCLKHYFLPSSLIFIHLSAVSCVWFGLSSSRFTFLCHTGINLRRWRFIAFPSVSSECK